MAITRSFERWRAVSDPEGAYGACNNPIHAIRSLQSSRPFRDMVDLGDDLAQVARLEEVSDLPARVFWCEGNDEGRLDCDRAALFGGYALGQVSTTGPVSGYYTHRFSPITAAEMATFGLNEFLDGIMRLHVGLMVTRFSISCERGSTARYACDMRGKIYEQSPFYYKADDFDVNGNVITTSSGLLADDTYTPSIGSYGIVYSGESPLFVGDCTVEIEGTWDGTDWSGGTSLSIDMEDVGWEYRTDFYEGYEVGGGLYIQKCLRNRRSQSVNMRWRFQDETYLEKLADADTFNLRMHLVGAGSHETQLVFPLLQFHELSLEGDSVIFQNANMPVAQHGTYGSIQMKVVNQVATYLV